MICRLLLFYHKFNGKRRNAAGGTRRRRSCAKRNGIRNEGNGKRGCEYERETRGQEIFLCMEHFFVKTVFL